MMYDELGGKSHDWTGRTFPEINEVAGASGSVAVLPVGSVEQHGHHLPVGTDTILVDAIAQLAAERADSVPLLVLPPVWAGFSPHHVSFGGAVTADFRTLHQYLTDITESLISSGFDAVLLLNGHGGNISLVNGTADTVGDAHPDTSVLSLTYFQLANTFIDEIRDSDPGGMGHGGEFETSLMLSIRPDLVRRDRMNVTYRSEPYDDAGREMFDSGPLSIYRPFDEYTDEGQLGDPTLATEEKGDELYDRLGDAIGRVVRQIHRQTRGNSAEGN